MRPIPRIENITEIMPKTNCKADLPGNAQCETFAVWMQHVFCGHIRLMIDECVKIHSQRVGLALLLLHYFSYLDYYFCYGPALILY